MAQQLCFWPLKFERLPLCILPWRNLLSPSMNAHNIGGYTKCRRGSIVFVNANSLGHSGLWEGVWKGKGLSDTGVQHSELAKLSKSLSVSVWLSHSGGRMEMAFKSIDYSKAGLCVLFIALCLLNLLHLLSLSHPVRPSLLKLVSQSMGFESKQVLRPGFFFLPFFPLTRETAHGSSLQNPFRRKGIKCLIQVQKHGAKTFFFQKNHLWSLYSSATVSKAPNNLNVALFTLICGKSNIQPWVTR